MELILPEQSNTITILAIQKEEKLPLITQYLANNSDLTNFFSSANGYATSESIIDGAIRHYINYGHEEGRSYLNILKINDYQDPFECKNYLIDTFKIYINLIIFIRGYLNY